MRRVTGFTLIEVMVALAVMGIVAVLTAQSFHTATKTSETLLENMERLAEVDRAWFSIESDLKYAINRIYRERFGKPIPPLSVSMGDDYWLIVMRRSVANPLYQPRSEEVRVGYRYVEDELWRDTWFNPTYTDEEDARPRRILTGIENISVRVLSNKATSLAAGPWEQDWPNTRSGTDLPKALEITLELEDMGEITRIFSILPGKAEKLQQSGGGGNSNGGQQ